MPASGRGAAPRRDAASRRDEGEVRGTRERPTTNGLRLPARGLTAKDETAVEPEGLAHSHSSLPMDEGRGERPTDEGGGTGERADGRRAAAEPARTGQEPKERRCETENVRGMMECWSRGVVESWSIGAMGPNSNGRRPSRSPSLPLNPITPSLHHSITPMPRDSNTPTRGYGITPALRCHQNLTPPPMTALVARRPVSWIRDADRSRLGNARMAGPSVPSLHAVTFRMVSKPGLRSPDRARQRLPLERPASRAT